MEEIVRAEVTARFDGLWRARLERGRLPAVLIADGLAEVAAEVLHADGAGITLLAGPEMRAPMGASDELASTAERVQFTVGEGPCFEVFKDQHPAVFDQDALEGQYPAFFDLLVSRTPFRSISATPLGVGQSWGMLDVYHRRTRPEDQGSAIAAVGERITAVLATTSALAEALESGTLSEDPAPWDDRMRVWQATGMTGVALDLTMSDSLAVLRGAAYSMGIDVDDLAEDIATGISDPRQLLEQCE